MQVQSCPSCETSTRCSHDKDAWPQKTHTDEGSSNDRCLHITGNGFEWCESRSLYKQARRRWSRSVFSPMFNPVTPDASSQCRTPPRDQDTSEHLNQTPAHTCVSTSQILQSCIQELANKQTDDTTHLIKRYASKRKKQQQQGIIS